MKWITNCLASLYSSSCTNEVSTTTILPSINPEPLSPIIPIDCKGCSKPCAHPNVPPHLNIDQSKPLKNTVPPYSIHIIIMTGKSNWPAHIEDEGLAGAFIEAIRKRKENDKMRPPESRYHPAFYASSEKDDCHRIIVTNASLPSKYSYQHKGTDVLLLPDNVIFSNITPRRVNALLDYIFGKPCSQAFSVYPCPYSSLVLVCGHGNKDRRCGTIGPMLQKSLQQAASQDEEGNHVQIALSSHLGGKCVYSPRLDNC